MEHISMFFYNLNEEAIGILVALLTIVLVAITAVWIYNRKKYHELAHQIPAGVVKNYLDSVIQNSSALKSSLFRGGGMELGDGIPSVLSTTNLGGGDNVSIDTELLNRKIAEIAALQTQVSEKNNKVSELEKKVAQLQASGGSSDSSAEIGELNSKISDLEKQLKAALAAAEAAAANAGGGGGSGEADEALKTELESVKKERNELKERLQEYEIIEDDLANLKRLQQENEQLKKALAGQGGSLPPSGGGDDGGAAAPPVDSAPAAADPAPPAAAAAAPASAPVADEQAPAAEVDSEPVAEAPEAAETPDAPEAPEAVAEAPAVEGDGKSAEDLLSEFEKMLG